MLSKSNIILILALVALTAIIVRQTEQHMIDAKNLYTAMDYIDYQKQCWDADTQTNLSTDACVESKFWGQDE